MNNINPGAIGSNISNAFRNNRDSSSIDKILMEANASEDPNAIDDAMRKIVGNVAPQNQGTALQLLQNKQKNLMAAKAPKKGADASNFQKNYEKAEAEELIQSPKKINEYQDLIKDLQEMRELTDDASVIGSRAFRGVFNREKVNRYKALQAKMALASTGLLKGTQSDKDMALILQQTGDIGDIGGVKVYDNLINRAEENLKRQGSRANELYEKYKGQGAMPPPKIPVKQTVEQAQKNIFKGQKEANFSRQDGEKIKVASGNNQQIISALSQGYAPEGTIAMMDTEGYPNAVPTNQVQNQMNQGWIILYGN